MTGERIREWRQAHGLSQAELAERLLVAVGTVHRWETGKTHPTRGMRRRLEQLIADPVE